ncbi:4'-phosphopantetheinyl transferase family protein [Microbacterium sp.]|uniref:4'-phosphopantetheinyl transferase family protein n=1 Tax=Microbacterium sp. TaxID=51671 RepID=UPI003A843BC0
MEILIGLADRVERAMLARLHAALPAARREKADAYLRPQDRDTSILSFALLQLLWEQRHGTPMPDVQLGRYGKPAFADGNGMHFSLSHDGTVCACVSAPVPVGIDVQSRVGFDGGLFERIASERERSLRDVLRRADDLSSLWTRKEALVKRTGRGLTVPLPSVEGGAAPDVVTFSCGAPDFRMSLSAEGMTRAAIASRVRVRFAHPAHVGWRFAPGADLLQPMAEFAVAA